MKRYIFTIQSKTEQKDILFCLKNIGYHVWACNEEEGYDQKVTNMLMAKIRGGDALRKMDSVFNPTLERKYYNRVILTKKQLDLLTVAIQTLGSETDLGYDTPQVQLFKA